MPDAPFASITTLVAHVALTACGAGLLACAEDVAGARDLDTFDDDGLGAQRAFEACLATCVDGDPCTTELCRDDGTCVHAPARAEEACLTSAHCDDDNPCTVDRCAVDACGFDRCAHDQIDGCIPCDANGLCEDGDPCTIERCGGDGICVLAEGPDRHCMEGCEPLRASDFGTFPPPVLGTTEWLRGTVRTEDTSCDGECACTTDLMLEGINSEQLALRRADEAWSCTTDLCTAAASCAPLVYGARYVVWGEVRGQIAREQPPQDFEVFPSLKDVMVEGWCLAPGRANVDRGIYTGRFESDGLGASFTLRILVGNDGVMRAALSDCPNCAALGIDAPLDLVVGPSSARLDLVIPMHDGLALAPLFPQADRFVGDVVRQGDGTYVGELTLVLKAMDL